MPNSTNISSVISPSVLSNISNATAIKTFGDQLVNKAKDKVVSIVKGKIGEIKDFIEELTKKTIQLSIDHSTELKRLEVLYKDKQLTEDQYNEAVALENAAFELANKDLNDAKDKFNEELAKLISDPYKKIKEQRRKRKNRVKKVRSKNKADRAKARRNLAKKLLKNAAKTLAPIIALKLTNELIAVISQRDKLEVLVNQVNEYIVSANTAETIQIATNLRNNTITLINNSIRKLQNIKQVLDQITLYITIFSLIVAILSAIPIPVAVPPGIGIPFNLITKIIKTLEKANKLIASLSVVLAICSILLEKEIDKLNELIAKLKEIGQILDQSALDNLNNQELTDLTSSLLTNVDQFEEYKGFKFKIKEEQTLGAQQAVVVKGIKRHYAVAVNRDGVEQLKSEYSFTQDPNDLIEQLKLIIDQKNLQG
jgi:hypothetical protein